MRLIAFTFLIFLSPAFAAVNMPADFQLALGHRTSCALVYDGVSCWGHPYDLPENMGTVTAISSGMLHSCALNDKGEVFCWGQNYSGQLDVPEDLGAAINITAGGGHTCAQTHVGVKCWGENSDRQADVPLNLGHVLSLTAGYMHTCAQTDLGVTCWGNQQMLAPKDLGKVDAISAGGLRTCAIIDKKLRCWGDHMGRKLYIPNDLAPVKQVAVGTFHICALTDEDLRCWGSNADGQIDVPKSLAPFLAVGTGDAHTCALTENHGLKCWGASYALQTRVPPNFPIASYEPSKLAWKWKCAGTISGKAVATGTDSCNTNDLKIYHVTSEYFRSEGSLTCAAKKFGPSLHIDTRISANQVGNAEGSVIGVATDDQYFTDEVRGSSNENTAIEARPDGRHLSFIKTYTDHGDVTLKIQLECEK